MLHSRVNQFNRTDYIRVLQLRNLSPPPWCFRARLVLSWGHPLLPAYAISVRRQCSIYSVVLSELRRGHRAFFFFRDPLNKKQQVSKEATTVFEAWIKSQKGCVKAVQAISPKTQMDSSVFISHCSKPIAPLPFQFTLHISSLAL